MVPSPDQARVVSVPVDAPADRIYRFARQMENLPRWASGLASGISQEHGRWFADSPMGRILIDMAPDNPFGVLDHDVTVPGAGTTHNAFRVTPVGAGAVLSFVVLRAPDADDETFARDADHVERDLRALKALMESARPG